MTNDLLVFGAEEFEQLDAIAAQRAALENFQERLFKGERVSFTVGIEGFNQPPPRYLTAQKGGANYQIAMEQIHGGIFAAIAAGIAIVVGLIYKLIKMIKGDGHGMGSGGSMISADNLQTAGRRAERVIQSIGDSEILNQAKFSESAKGTGYERAHGVVRAILFNDNYVHAIRTLFAHHSEEEHTALAKELTDAINEGIAIKAEYDRASHGDSQNAAPNPVDTKLTAHFERAKAMYEKYNLAIRNMEDSARGVFNEVRKSAERAPNGQKPVMQSVKDWQRMLLDHEMIAYTHASFRHLPDFEEEAKELDKRRLAVKEEINKTTLYTKSSYMEGMYELYNLLAKFNRARAMQIQTVVKHQHGLIATSSILADCLQAALDAYLVKHKGAEEMYHVQDAKKAVAELRHFHKVPFKD